MKFVIIASLAMVLLGGLAMIIYVLRYEKTHPNHRAVACVVMTENAVSYMFPGREFKARGDIHGVVEVVGRKGDWWQLRDGTYMPSYCLRPVHSGEVPRELV